MPVYLGWSESTKEWVTVFSENDLGNCLNSGLKFNLALMDGDLVSELYSIVSNLSKYNIFTQSDCSNGDCPHKPTPVPPGPAPGPAPGPTAGSCKCLYAPSPTCDVIKCAAATTAKTCANTGNGWCSWSGPIPPKNPDGCYGKATYPSDLTLLGYWYAPNAKGNYPEAPPSSVNMAIAFPFGSNPTTMLQMGNPKPEDLVGEWSATKKFPNPNIQIKAINFGGGVAPNWTAGDDAALDKYFPYILAGGYNAVSFDLEYLDANLTSDFIDGICSKFKKCGFHVSITIGGRGVFSPVGLDLSKLNMDNVDIIIPQMYGSDGSSFDLDFIEKCGSAWLGTGPATWITTGKPAGKWELQVIPPKKLTPKKLALGYAFDGGLDPSEYQAKLKNFQGGVFGWCTNGKK